MSLSVPTHKTVSMFIRTPSQWDGKQYKGAPFETSDVLQSAFERASARGEISPPIRSINAGNCHIGYRFSFLKAATPQEALDYTKSLLAGAGHAHVTEIEAGSPLPQFRRAETYRPAAILPSAA